MIAARPDFTKVYVMAADDQQVDVIYQQDWATNHLTITSTVENSIPLPSAPVGLFLRMTSIGQRSRDEQMRLSCSTTRVTTYACTQDIGKKR